MKTLAQNKIAAVGDRDSVMLWRALGVETVFADNALSVAKAIDRLAREGTAVIYITEQSAELIPDTIKRYLTEPFPAIIPIPNREGTTGYGLAGIKKNVDKAIGADILFADEDK